MPTYKYTLKNGRIMWYAAFYYLDWTGQRKHCVKRGFPTQKEAKEFEKEFLDKKRGRSDILFSSLVENYLDDMGHRLKPTTMETKRYILEKKILPYFGKLRICDIDTLRVRKWQDEMLTLRTTDGKKFSQTYLKTINEHLSAVLNYAVLHYGLYQNPCHAAGSIGKGKSEEMNFWTREQFDQFISKIKKTYLRIGFEILFWAGIRIGELLALTPADILDTKEIDINKDFVVVKGQSLIQTPKTPKSIRKISIPDSLYDEINEYISKLYMIQKNDRIFDCTKASFEVELKRVADAAKLPRIRLHDLRHSNVALLINMGTDIMEISRRLGHESTKTTWDTYGHLYPGYQEDIARKMNELRE